MPGKATLVGTVRTFNAEVQETWWKSACKRCVPAWRWAWAPLRM